MPAMLLDKMCVCDTAQVKEPNIERDQGSAFVFICIHLSLSSLTTYIALPSSEKNVKLYSINLQIMLMLLPTQSMTYRFMMTSLTLSTLIPVSLL